MIQRIQSIFLLIPIAVFLTLSLLPLGHLTLDEGVYTVTALGTSNIDGVPLDFTISTWPILVILLFLITFLFFTIFQFKNRKLQVKLCRAAILAMISFLVFIVTYGEHASVSAALANGKTNASFNFSLAPFLTLISIVSTFLAIHRIKKDEALVRAADRLR